MKEPLCFLLFSLLFVFTGFRPSQGLFSRGSWLPVTRGTLLSEKSSLVLTVYLQEGTRRKTMTGKHAIKPRRRHPTQNRLESNSAGICERSLCRPVLPEEISIRCFIVREPRTRLRKIGPQVFWKPLIQLMRPFGRGRNTNENHPTERTGSPCNLIQR